MLCMSTHLLCGDRCILSRYICVQTTLTDSTVLYHCQVCRARHREYFTSWCEYSNWASIDVTAAQPSSWLQWVTYLTRHRASTSMYSLTFRVHVATPVQYGRNGTASLVVADNVAHAAGASILSLARACVVRAACAEPGGLPLADYRWALPRISIMLP